MPIDYSKWKNIEVSDDEDDTHPNIDTPSLFRWRHQARVDRMDERKKEKAELELSKNDSQRKMAEIRKKLEEMNLGEQEKQKLTVELEALKKQEDEWRKKEDELTKKERLEPWNVDTIAHDGFSKSRINKVEGVSAQPQVSDDEKDKKMREFYDKNEDQIKKFGMLRKWDDSKQFLIDNPHLCCEDTANYLTITCLNYGIEEKWDLMDHVAHQCIVMQYLIELAKQLNYSPQAPQLISSFFSKIKLADAAYLNMFDDELRAFKERIRKRAAEKRADAIAEVEAEEREKRLGPGGLDPVEVFESLPKEMQECFESRDIDRLKTIAEGMDQAVFQQHLKRCVDSGLWVADANKGAEAAGGQVEDMATESKDDGDKETEVRQRKQKQNP